MTYGSLYTMTEIMISLYTKGNQLSDKVSMQKILYIIPRIHRSLKLIIWCSCLGCKHTYKIAQTMWSFSFSYGITFIVRYHE